VRALAASAVFQGPLAEIAAAAAPDAVRAENVVPSTCVVRLFFFFFACFVWDSFDFNSHEGGTTDCYCLIFFWILDVAARDQDGAIVPAAAAADQGDGLKLHAAYDARGYAAAINEVKGRARARAENMVTSVSKSVLFR
jgi:hypothetical protein